MIFYVVSCGYVNKSRIITGSQNRKRGAARVVYVFFSVPYFSIFLYAFAFLCTFVYFCLLFVYFLNDVLDDVILPIKLVI